MTTYYVGSGGSDAADGLSWANRKLTLNGAEDVSVAAGDTVYVGPGVYRHTLTVDVSGSAGNIITYIADVTGQNTDADMILGLDSGANDYVTKPFKFPVLLARIRAQLRQHEQSEDAIFQLGPYTFKPSMKMLITEDDKKIRLTEKETNILKFPYRSNDGVVARDVLLHEVWGYNAGVTTHTLETHIYRLRQKIEPDPSNARLLVTESGGYRLVA